MFQIDGKLVSLMMDLKAPTFDPVSFYLLKTRDVKVSGSQRNNNPDSR